MAATKERKQTKKWTQRSGEKIRICDMGDDHLINTLNLLKRNAVRKQQETENFYVSCSMPQGEMAMDAFDSEFDQVLDSHWTDYAGELFGELLLEAERRDLHDRIPA